MRVSTLSKVTKLRNVSRNKRVRDRHVGRQRLHAIADRACPDGMCLAERKELRVAFDLRDEPEHLVDAIRHMSVGQKIRHRPSRGRDFRAGPQVAASSSSLTAPLRRCIFATSRTVTSGLRTKKRSHSKAKPRRASTDLRSAVPLNPSHTPRKIWSSQGPASLRMSSMYGLKSPS